MKGEYELDTAIPYEGTTDTMAPTENYEQKAYTTHKYLETITEPKTSQNEPNDFTIHGDGSLVINLYYTRNTYAVTYDGNGNTDGKEPTDDGMYPSGAAVTVMDKNTLVREGAVFLGWSLVQTDLITTQDDENKAIETGIYSANDKLTMPEQDITLYAIWAIDTNGPTNPTDPTDPTEPVDPTDPPIDPTQPGEPDEIPDYKQYSVTYHPNGAQGNVPTDNRLYDLGNHTTVLNKNTLTKTDAVFLGWTLQVDPATVTTQAEEDAIELIQPQSWLEITGNMNLYAVWAIDANGPTPPIDPENPDAPVDPTEPGEPDEIPDYKEYPVTYDGNGNTAGSVPVDGKLYPTGTNATVLGNLNGLQRAGATFIGWSLTQHAQTVTTLEEELGLAILDPGDVVTMLEGGVRLYAVWAIDELGPNDVPDYREMQVAGVKTWVDGDNVSLTRPLTITINLLRDGTEIAERIVRANPNGEWTYDFGLLPRYDENNRAYTYTITEDAVAGYTTVIDGFNVTNRIVQTTHSVTVNKIWRNAPGAHPTIRVNLLLDGRLLDYEDLTNGVTQYTFPDVPMYDPNDGHLYTVTITEDTVEGFTTTIDGTTIINTAEAANEETPGTRTLTIEEMAVPLGFGGTIMNVGDCFE